MCKFLACFISLISQINKSVIQDDKWMACKPFYNQHNHYSFYLSFHFHIYISWGWGNFGGLLLIWFNGTCCRDVHWRLLDCLLRKRKMMRMKYFAMDTRKACRVDCSAFGGSKDFSLRLHVLDWTNLHVHFCHDTQVFNSFSSCPIRRIYTYMWSISNPPTGTWL